MGNHEEDCANHKRGILIGHEEEVADERKEEAYFDESGHEVISGRVLAVDIVEHEDHGEGLQHLKPEYSKAFTDNFEEHCDQYVEIEKWQLL